MAGNFAVSTAFKAKDGVTPSFNAMTKGAGKFQNRLNKLSYSTRGFGNCIQGTVSKVNALMNATMAFVAAGAVKNMFGGFVDKASDLQETIGKTTEVFKENSKSVLDWAKTSIKSMGLAEQTALDSASLFGDMATGMDISTKRASEMSMNLTKLSADLSSFKNIGQDVAETALSAVFTGETESLKKLGVIMTETALQEYALSKGIQKKVSDMKQAEKVELRYQYVLAKTKNAQGDFIRTEQNYANQRRIWLEKWKQTQTNWGNFMLPYYTKVMASLNAWHDRHATEVENSFGRIIKALASGWNVIKPVFDKLGETVKYLSGHLFPELGSYAPALKSLFEDVLVPGLVLAIDAMNKLFEAIDKTYNFIKDHWIPIVSLMAGVGGMLALKKAFDITTGAIAWYNTTLMIAGANGIQAISGFKKIGFILGGYTSAIWKSVTAIWAQTTALLANPWTWVAVGIAAVVAGAILIWKNWDKITAVMGEWWGKATTWLSGFWGKIQEVFGAVGSFIKNHFIDILLNCLGPIGLIIRGVKKVSSLFNAFKGGKKGDEDPGVNNDGGVNNVNNNVPVFKTPAGNNSNNNGRIDVGISIDNKSMFPASSSLELTGSSNLNLSPA